MKLSQSICILILLEIAALATAHLSEKLNHYEIIDRSNIRHQIRRRAANDGGYIREVTLSVLGRTLELELVPKPELFSSSFEAVTVDSEGNEKKFDFDQSEFYHGYLKGEEQSSSITAQINNDLLTAAIDSKNDTYHIEPASGHITGNVSNKMIAYRDSDVNWNLTFARNQTQKLCGINSADAETTTAEPAGQGHEDSSARRHPRSLKDKEKKLCGLALVADYLYFKNIGEGDKRTTTHSMVAVINRADELFKNTDWSDDKNDPYKNYGFVIKKVIVHEDEKDSQTLTYNKPLSKFTENYGYSDLLEEFGKSNFSTFCLAHLFTYRDFYKGVIGYAYIAAPYDNIHGVCGRRQDICRNTGLSSSINWGERLLTAQSDIVTVHELGHNFGSKHDRANSRCSPETGGKYIMYAASVSGREKNNNKFSPCSREAVKNVLKSKAPFCFSVPEQSGLCGNFRVEGEEKCDPGTSGDDDPCCTSGCVLRKDARCSDSNFEQPCCSSCQPVNKTDLQVCSSAQPMLCKKVSYCDGSSAVCPRPEFADEGTDCIERGKCDGEGNCQPFCKTQNKNWTPCLCTNENDACFVCCKKNNTCEVHLNGSSRIPMSNGRLCYGGVCYKETCTKYAQDTLVQAFLTSLSSPSKFGKFLKVNIAGTVIFFSLIVWIPLSIIVNRIDKRRDKHAQALARWQDIQNPELIRQPNKGRDFDVVFKKGSVFLRDSRNDAYPGSIHNQRRTPVVE